jgi:hypothetical protein
VPKLVEKNDQDCTVPIAQSVLLYNALKKAGAEAEYHLLLGAGLGDTGGYVGSSSTADIARMVSLPKCTLH